MKNKCILWLGGYVITAMSLTTSYAQTNLPQFGVKELTDGQYRHITDAVKHFTEADLPAFLEIIKEDRPPREYYPALEAIAYVSRKNDEKVVDALVDFLKSPVNWDKWLTDTKVANVVLTAKTQALTAMSKIGGDKAEAVLKRAITVEGAEEFSKAWIGGWPEEHALSKGDIVGTIRGRAADMLARSEKCEDLVRAEYAKERQVCINSGKETQYFSGLISGLAYIDSVKEVGKGNPIPSGMLSQNIKKYQLTRSDKMTR